MSSYRIYRLDPARHITSGDWFEAETDDEAIRLAQAKLQPDTPTVEIWCGPRLVATLNNEVPD